MVRSAKRAPCRGSRGAPWDVRQRELDRRVVAARKLVSKMCEDNGCWEGCNDREGKLPCIHDILWEGACLWEKQYPTVKDAEYV